MKIYKKYGCLVIDGEYHKDGRKAVGGSLCPWGWDYPWISVYLFGLYICLRANFRLHKSAGSKRYERQKRQIQA